MDDPTKMGEGLDGLDNLDDRKDLQNLLNDLRDLGNPIRKVLPIIRKHNPNLDLRREFCVLITDGLVFIEIGGMVNHKDGRKISEIPEEDIDTYVLNLIYDMGTMSKIFVSPLWDSMPPNLHDNIFGNILHKEMAVREMLEEFYDANTQYIREVDIDASFQSHHREGTLPNEFCIRIFCKGLSGAKTILDLLREDLATYGLDNLILEKNLLSEKGGFPDDDAIGDASFEKCQDCPGAFIDCSDYTVFLARLDEEDPEKAKQLRALVAASKIQFDADPMSLIMKKLGGLGNFPSREDLN